jgi:hypothetical protein
LPRVGLTRDASDVSFGDFLTTVPPIVRLLLAIVITAGISMLCVHLFHSKLLEINATPKKANDDDPDPPPGVKDISGRLIALTTFAFVFLLGFGFSQFWSTAKDARDAVLNEATDYQRAVSAAQRLPSDQAQAMTAALEKYRASTIQTEWPLMLEADSSALAQARFDNAAQLTETMYAEKDSQDSSSAAWTQMTDAVDDLLSNAIDRSNALPSPLAVSMVLLVFVLGLINLVAIALFQPAQKKANLLVVGMMAALTGFLLFVLVEISNPYAGAGAVTAVLLGR